MRFRSLVFVLVPVSLQAQVARDSTFSISSSRTTHAVADRATFYVVVEGTAETAPDAVTRVETKLKAVLEAIKTSGARVEVDVPIGYTVGATQNQNGYPMPASPAMNLARSVIRVQLNRVDQLSRVIGAAIAAGASSTSLIAFESSNADSIRRARLAETIAAARADAEAMATALGGHVGALVDANSTAAPNYQQPPILNFDGRFGSQYAAPEVMIITSATLRFRLVR